MRHGSLVFAALVAAGVAPAAIAAPPDSIGLGDSYLVNGDKTQMVTVSSFGRDVYMVMGKGWDGVGLLTGTTYWGVFRQSWGTAADAPASARGTHRGTLRPDGSVAIHGEYTSGLTGTFDVLWMPAIKAPALMPTPESSKPGDHLPEFGEYVLIDELPEALTKVPPEYSDDAKRARLEGTVLVQALVGADGRVKDTKVVKSISGLDGAAVAAVRQWIFKPALSKGKPVAVWVAVPVRFVAPTR
jgi:TonB family protein